MGEKVGWRAFEKKMLLEKLLQSKELKLKAKKKKKKKGKPSA